MSDNDAYRKADLPLPSIGPWLGTLRASILQMHHFGRNCAHLFSVICRIYFRYVRKSPKTLNVRLPPEQSPDPAQILTQSVSDPSQHFIFQFLRNPKHKIYLSKKY